MSYHLKLNEQVPAGIKRVVREEIASAILQLTGKGESDPDEAIHEARKSMKKIRALLRLVRSELGAAYVVENTNYRDVGQLLSQFRDAGAIVETFDALRHKYRANLGSVRLTGIRRGLVARKKQAEKLGNVGKVLRGLAAVLRRSDKRVRDWPLSTEGFAAISPGFEDTLRRGQKALARVHKHASPENFHEWRKRVKDHWYHIRLLEQGWDATLPAYERRLKDLETWLGDDHNLVVLEEKVMAEPNDYGKPAEVSALSKLIRQYRRELRADALAAGQSIYGAKPGQFVSRMRRMWDAAQSSPTTPLPTSPPAPASPSP